jgi:Ni/Co efflux regulator RcnB
MWPVMRITEEQQRERDRQTDRQRQRERERETETDALPQHTDTHVVSGVSAWEPSENLRNRGRFEVALMDGI